MRQTRKLDKRKFIQILPGLYYEKATGWPWSNRAQKDKTTVYRLKSGDSGYILVCQSSHGQRWYHYWHRIVFQHFKGNIHPSLVIDHIDNNKENNKIDNLQLVTNSQNCRKCMLYKNSQSGFKGVFPCKRSGRWVAQIRHEKKLYHIGYFSSAEEGAREYDKWAKKLHGDFALTNRDLGLL